MEHEVGFFANPHTWVNIGGLIFLAFAGPKIWKALTQMLDQRAIKIKADLDEAQKLKDEAQALLGEYQRKQKDALKEASEIIETAKTTAQHQAKEAAAGLEAAFVRREKLALEKIAQAEAAAIAEVRREAVDVAGAAARKLIAASLNDARASALIDAAIKDVNQRLH
ncbi:F0F1 ATP synthase subunit B family protein [Dongia rigui]|uniref:ATP synthase subunit b n=1 Tax=Dongia rigui TaxID=940149 RepID=A0ABU5DVI3_9PROT|nr:F0F1 ATP synthase subunit B [Dongia rigui]MDY0871328.1 F0F1 ATP synthase subunit B [Dongia rigui]